MDSNEVLILILSIGFIILIVFVCVAIGTMIKIMLDLKKISEIAKKEMESVSETMEAIESRIKSFLTNSMVLDKVVPAILGAITVGMGTKKIVDDYSDCKKDKKSSSKKKS